MKRLSIIVVVALAAAALIFGGCAPAATTTSPTTAPPTTIATTTPAPTPTAAPVPKQTPTPTQTQAPVPATSPPPEFSLTSLVISPDEALPGSSVQVTASVANTGNIAGDHTVTLRFHGRTESQNVALASGENKTVSFTFTAPAIGIYSIWVNTLKGTLGVIPAAPAGYKGYTDRYNGFFVAYPEGWKQENVGTAYLCKFAAQEDVQWNVQFVVGKQTVTQLTTPREVIRQYLEDQAKKLAGFSVLSIEELVINGVPAARGTYTFLLFEFPIKQQMVALITDNTCFSMNFSSWQVVANKYANTFNTIANSFTFLPTYQ